MPPITPFPNVQVAVRTLQFLCTGMFAGLFIASGVFSYVSTTVPVPKALPAAIFFVYVGLAAAIMQTLASLFLRGWMLSPDKLSQLPNEGWEMAAVRKFRTATIVSMAFCEGGGFLMLVFTLIAALNGAAEFYYFAGVIFPLGGMALHFPTQEKWERVRSETMRVKGIS